ncbi:MAG: hypothetical protein RLZZ458_2681, partial [Planctomycetota bacterium]
RIWVNIPGHGYVGVGRVSRKAVPITEFKVLDDQSKLRPITDVVSALPSSDRSADELEYFVKVDWIKTLSINDAIKEKGFFGNQNSVAKPKARKWIHTIERLKKRFEIVD